MNPQIRIRHFFSTIALLLFAMTFSLPAQTGGVSGVSSQVLLGPQVPFVTLHNAVVQGDYVAAGVGMRNRGYGTISLSIPAGATLTRAWLFWAVIDGSTPAVNTGDLNGVTITGTARGTSGTPCWGGSGITFYSADVTGIATTGLNALTNFPSGLTNGAMPQGNVVYPLMEGATLVAEFCHPAWDYNSIRIDAGAQTFGLHTVSSGFGSYAASSGGYAADETAKTTFIMADGQLRFANDATAINATPTSGPGTGIKTADAFDGADGTAFYPLDGLWDTHTLDISSFFPTPALTALTATAVAGSGGDCLSWGVQVTSVKSALHVNMDVKPGSCPNSFNVNNNGMLPADILGSAGFDVSAIDPSTVTLNGVSPTGSALFQDASTPFMDACGPMDCYDCNTTGPDGYTDLHFKFKSADVAATLGAVQNDDCVEVWIAGKLYDGRAFMARDVLRIINNSSPKSHPDASALALTLEQNSPNPVRTSTSFTYTLPEAATVRLEVFNTLGQQVATVVSTNQPEGMHTVAWDGLNNNGTPLTPGTYLYRLTVGKQVLSRTLVIAR